MDVRESSGAEGEKGWGGRKERERERGRNRVRWRGRKMVEILVIGIHCSQCHQVHALLGDD